jgi:ubiquinone/menaquinone biosynthesis C-methylase UbiE
VWRDDTAHWSDRFFFLDVIGQYGEPVLDIGCGTGRLLLDYLAQGIDIDGVDNSGEMLAICRTKAQRQGMPAPALYQQRMEQLKLPRSYRTILGPSSVLQLRLFLPTMKCDSRSPSWNLSHRYSLLRIHMRVNQPAMGGR